MSSIRVLDVQTHLLQAKSLPPSLTTVSFEQELPTNLIFPPSLRTLECSPKCLTKLNSYPPLLTRLYLPDNIVYIPLPPTLTHLSTPNHIYTEFPSSLTLLILRRVASYLEDKTIANFPPNLMCLELCGHFETIFPPLPSTLHSLVIYGTFQHELNFPHSLTFLEIRGYNFQIRDLPPSLTNLTIDQINCHIQLPPSLLSLRILKKCTQPLIAPSTPFCQSIPPNEHIFLPIVLKNLEFLPCYATPPALSLFYTFVPTSLVYRKWLTFMKHVLWMRLNVVAVSRYALFIKFNYFLYLVILFIIASV
jgi:hypothetical protein